LSTASFIEIRTAGPASVARITCPSIGQREAPIIEEALKGAAKSSRFNIVLDMTTVTVLGSLGLGMLVTITKECRDGGGRLAIFGLSSSLQDLVKLTRLDKFLLIAKDEAAALAAMR